MGRHWDQRSPRSRGRREGRRRRRRRRGPRGWEPVHRWRSGRSGGAGRGAGHTGTGRLREGVKRQLGQTMYSEGRYGGWVELNKRSDQMSEWFSFSETPVIKPDYLMTSLTVSPPAPRSLSTPIRSTTSISLLLLNFLQKTVWLLLLLRRVLLLHHSDQKVKITF